MTISLCMICGNEAGVILNCLESAKTVFDELCLVSAIGNQYEDNTLSVAGKWCSENGKKFHVERYRNAADFPHVDNFGAARNLSFDLATSDWLLWLDCDDYLDDINCQRIRAAAETCEEYDALYCTYKVADQGAEILRERLIRRGHGRWKNPIHETCVITGKAGECPQITVFHSKHDHKHQSSAQRNANILLATLADAPRHYFYLQAELKMLKRHDEARKAALCALALLDEAQVELRYIVLLNLSELQPELTEQRLHEAARIQPHRREAFAYACQKALIDGRTSDAVSYFRIMDALPLPAPLPWTHQGIWYGWARNDLRVRVLRACGNTELADAEHTLNMKDQAYAEGTADKSD